LPRHDLSFLAGRVIVPSTPRRVLARWKKAVLRAAVSTVARATPRPATYRTGTTVVTVNWNSLPYLRAMLAATRGASPADVEFLVVDNGSSDGSREWLATQQDVRVLRLPINVGHGGALDLAMPRIDTEFVAVLDVDAFPVSARWLDESVAALERGAVIAGARMHRNFIHPCFLVMRTRLIHQYGLTFVPVGSLSRADTRAPLFLDVGEAMSQRMILKFGGGHALYPFEITSTRGPGVAGAVFGGLVYHNAYATQGRGRDGAIQMWHDALAEYHPDVAEESERDVLRSSRLSGAESPGSEDR
jgi:cellulose synthase/poly-beta-1,6-N-acetylglucosamine synthase-like glycosyltransferase